MFGGLLLAGALDEDAAHGLGRGGEEVPPAVPVLGQVAADQPEVGLVDQGGRLERLARVLAPEPRGGELAQLGVDEREEFGGGLAVSGRRCVEQLGCLRHAVSIPARSSRGPRSGTASGPP